MDPRAQSELINWANAASALPLEHLHGLQTGFYYKYILRLHEQDEFEDEMTASTFGTIVHKVLEDGFDALKPRASDRRP